MSFFLAALAYIADPAHWGGPVSVFTFLSAFRAYPLFLG